MCDAQLTNRRRHRRRHRREQRRRLDQPRAEQAQRSGHPGVPPVRRKLAPVQHSSSCRRSTQMLGNRCGRLLSARRIRLSGGLHSRARAASLSRSPALPAHPDSPDKVAVVPRGKPHSNRLKARVLRLSSSTSGFTSNGSGSMRTDGRHRRAAVRAQIARSSSAERRGGPARLKRQASGLCSLRAAQRAVRLRTEPCLRRRFTLRRRRNSATPQARRAFSKCAASSLGRRGRCSRRSQCRSAFLGASAAIASLRSSSPASRSS